MYVALLEICDHISETRKRQSESHGTLYTYAVPPEAVSKRI